MNALIVSPLLIPLATLVATLLARRAPRAVTALSLAGALALTAAGLVLVGLAAPITEEILMRGVVLAGLLRNYRPVVAIAQSALLFGVMHMNPAQSLNAFFLGCCWGGFTIKATRCGCASAYTSCTTA